MAKHFGIPFFEVSSKNNINIDDSFLRMVSMINEMESENTIKKVIWTVNIGVNIVKTIILS